MVLRVEYSTQSCIISRKLPVRTEKYGATSEDRKIWRANYILTQFGANIILTQGGT
jgi:hypothetical protein